jgi:arsenate reductase (thioredoxin)
MEPPMKRPYNVLFLCTGNSSRSILAEAILNAIGKDRFRAFSAGSHPTGQVNAFALEQLRGARLATEGLRSKSWNEFAVHGAPELDFVFTVCDQAAGEICPMWPGQPMTSHWGVPDPAAIEGDREKIRRAFFVAYEVLFRRISLFTALRLENLERLALQRKLDEIGEIFPKAANDEAAWGRAAGRAWAMRRRSPRRLAPGNPRIAHSGALDPSQFRRTPAC